MTDSHSAKIDGLAIFVKTHLLDSFRDAANDSCGVVDINRRHLKNYSFGATFWEGSSSRIVDLGKKGGPLEGCVTFNNNDLQIQYEDLQFRCHRVNPHTGVPNGGNASKQAALMKGSSSLVFLPGMEEAFVDKGEIIIGLDADLDEGLIGAQLGLLVPTYDRNKTKITFKLLKTLYTSSSLADLPKVEEQPSSKGQQNRPRLEKIGLGVKIQNE
ncbi:hypothetical protein [Maridesulfovibrio sp.]|uniref:hypothetical protein n=1 Tax=Maridesulfovibrio sp. TaxID=2795000 RepID=UPI003BAC31B5